MKKWLKWTLGIVGVIVLVIVIYVAWNWTMFGIVSGTEELSGESSVIPEIAGTLSDSLRIGETDWASWYGPDGDRIAKEKNIQSDWSKGLTKVWEVNYLCQGAGSASWSAPVIQGNRLVISGRDSENDLVFCLNPTNGNLLWYQSYASDASSSHGSGPRATPFIDKERVYTFGRNGDLACWQLLDGKALWRINVSDNGGEEPTWGHSSSPLVVGNLVIVQGGGNCRTIAYNKMTGEMVWKSGTGLPGYAAIKDINIADRQVLLVFHGTGLTAMMANDGNELWTVNWRTSYDMNATTPVVNGNQVFITSGYGTGSILLNVKADGIDSLWRNDDFASIHSDPYIIDGHIYGFSGDSWQNKGAFKCVNLERGEEKWSSNDIGWGTCVYVDGYLLCTDIKGNIALVKPNPNEFTLVTSLSSALGDIKGPVWTTPVISNGYLYLRFKQNLVCYDIIG